MRHVITSWHIFQKLEFVEPLVVHFGFKVLANLKISHLLLENFLYESLVDLFEMEFALAIHILF